MRLIVVMLGCLVAATAAGLSLQHNSAEPPSVVAPVGGPRAAPTILRQARDDSTPSSPRETEEIFSESHEEDPRLAQQEADNEALMAVSRDLEREVARLKRELGYVLYPETEPFNHFLSLPEAAQLTDPRIRAFLGDVLRMFPVLLLPGEATWFFERETNDDWLLHGRSVETTIIRMLGSDRLLREMPEENLERLLRFYPEEFGR